MWARKAEKNSDISGVPMAGYISPFSLLAFDYEKQERKNPLKGPKSTSPYSGNTSSKESKLFTPAPRAPQASRPTPVTMNITSQNKNKNS